MRLLDSTASRSDRDTARVRSLIHRWDHRLHALSVAARKRLGASVARLLWITMALPIALVVVGCASGNDELRKQLDEMSAEIRELRAAALASQDRLDALEEDDRAVGAGAAAEAPRKDATERPTLEVVRLSPNPEATSQPGDPLPWQAPVDDEGERPVLRADRHGGSVEVEGDQAHPGGGGRRPMARSR